MRSKACGFFGTVGTTELCLAEGYISLYHPRSSEYELVLSKRFNNANHGVHAFVFREERQWSAVLMIGDPHSGLNIDHGLYVGVSASTLAELRRVLAIVADRLFYFTGSPIAAVRLRDGLPDGALQAVMEKLQEKEAEPGATDNPDDAQRLREDH